MPLTADDFRRRYAELSDEGLRSINPDELTPLARQVYEQELASRHLGDAVDEEESAEAPAPDGGESSDVAEADPLIELAKCNSLEEAIFYRDLLRQAGIESQIPSRLASSVNWAGTYSNIEVPLMVRESQLAEATEIMEASISDEELAEQAEAAAPKDIEPEEEDIEPE